MGLPTGATGTAAVASAALAHPCHGVAAPVTVVMYMYIMCPWHTIQMLQMLMHCDTARSRELRAYSIYPHHIETEVTGCCIIQRPCCFDVMVTHRHLMVISQSQDT